MIDRNYINEYASAIYQLSKEYNAKDEFRLNLIEITEVFNDNPVFLKVLCSYSLDDVNKKDLINKIFKNSIHPALINLFYYLIDKNLEKNIVLIAERVISFIDEKTNRIYVKIYSPFKIDDSTIEVIKQKLNKITKKESITTVIIDPDLIGGIRIEYDSQVLDYSIESKIRNIKQTMNRGD